MIPAKLAEYLDAKNIPIAIYRVHSKWSFVFCMDKFYQGETIEEAFKKLSLCIKNDLSYRE